MTRKETDKAEIIFDGESLVRIHLHEHADLEAQDIIAINKAKTELVGETKHIVLFIPGIYSTMSAEARKISASKEINRNVFAKALVVFTPHQRIIGNFFIKFDRPPAPTSVFTNEKDALAWLQKMQKTAVAVH